MKILRNSLVVFLATLSLEITIPINSVLAEIADEGVTIAPSVRAKLQTASKHDRNKMDAAINAGNKFIPYHFDGSAYDFGDSGFMEEKKFWAKNVRPLINKNVGEWFNNVPVHVDTPHSKVQWYSEWGGGGLLLVCPTSQLISVVIVNKNFTDGWKQWYPEIFISDSVVLEYQAKIIGESISKGNDSPTFKSNEGNERETVLIGLEENGKINHVATHYADRTWLADRYIELMLRLYVNNKFSSNISGDQQARIKLLIQNIQSGKDEKKEILYQYITSIEFRQRMEAIKESFTGMQDEIEKEKRWFAQKWSRQEKQLRKVIDNTHGLYGDLEGVVGALPELKEVSSVPLPIESGALPLIEDKPF